MEPAAREADEVGMVSTGLETHSTVTQLNAALRYGKSLREREQAGETVRTAEWTCFEDLTSAARAAADEENMPQNPVEM